MSEEEWAKLFPRPKHAREDPMAGELRQTHRRLAPKGCRHGLTEDEWKQLFPPEVHVHSTVEESRQTNGLGGGRIIISSSGMLTGGRVLHHMEMTYRSRRV